MMVYVKIIVFFSFLISVSYGDPDDVNRALPRPEGGKIQCGYWLAKFRRGTEEGALARKIRRSPDDDVARLVFAERLDDLKEADRAQFVRDQVELSRLLGEYHTHSIDDLPQPEIYRARALQRSIAEQIEAHGQSWAPRGPGVVGADFRRGIVEGLVIDLSKSKALAGVEKYLRSHSDINRYTLVNATRERLHAFLNLPGIERISHLAIEKGQLTEQDLALFTNNPRLKNLKRLDIDGNRIGEAGICALASSPHLANLRNLGRLTEYVSPEEFEAHAVDWVQNRRNPFKMREEAYLELLEQGRMNFGDIAPNFTNGERGQIWEKILFQGRFQRRIGEEDFQTAVRLYYDSVPKGLQEKFADMYVRRNPVPYTLAREVRGNLANGRKLSDGHEFAGILVKRLPTLERWEKVSNYGVFEAAAKKTGKEKELEAAIPESFEFRRVPAGKMVLGSYGEKSTPGLPKEKPEPGRFSDENERSVEMSGFELQATQFTWAQFETIRPLFNQRSKRKFDQSPPEDRNRPLTHVSWEDTKLICEILTELDPHNKYELPTEAQWEFAIRGGTRSPYYYGKHASQLGEYAYYDENSNGQTQPVAKRKPNALGFYDMSGNVWEWARDKYTGDTTQLSGPDPNYQDSSSYRVIRGGSWNDYPQLLRSAQRNYRDPGLRYVYVGFRLLRTPK